MILWSTDDHWARLCSRHQRRKDELSGTSALLGTPQDRVTNYPYSLEKGVWWPLLRDSMIQKEETDITAMWQGEINFDLKQTRIDSYKPSKLPSDDVGMTWKEQKCRCEHWFPLGLSSRHSLFVSKGERPTPLQKMMLTEQIEAQILYSALCWH